MQPTRSLWRRPCDLLAADTTTLAAALALQVHLASAAFTPTLDLLLTDLTEATFTGSAALSLGSGVQSVFYDATTGFLTLKLLDPAGGYKWICTASPAVPQTIYGVYLTDNADAILYGAELLPTPAVISAMGQGIILPGELTLLFDQTSPH